MKLFELIVDDIEDEIFAISLVETPAIESNFVFFNKEELMFAKVEDEKRMVMGPVLIPDKKILRVDAQGQPYEVFFTKDTVADLARAYLKNKYTDSATLEHEEDIDGVHLVESWIKTSKSDKSNDYGLNVPIGTWMGQFYIENDEIWEEYVKEGKVKGFSIEGLFTHLDRSYEKRLAAGKYTVEWEDLIDKEVSVFSEEEASSFLSKIKDVILKGKKTELESYSDYGSGIKNNAKKGIELNEANGNKCATQTGKVRAQQLAKGEAISVETIKRMHSYLSRAEGEYDKSDDSSACANISYLLWGGKAALSWSRNKLRELGELQENAEPTVSQTYPGEVASGSIAPELLEEAEINVYGYDTSYFYICPGAIGTFKHLTEEMDIQDDDLKDMIRAAAVIADTVFMIEERVVREGKADERDLRRARILVEMFKDVFETVDERTGMKHDVSYMDGHVEVIKNLL